MVNNKALMLLFFLFRKLENTKKIAIAISTQVKDSYFEIKERKQNMVRVPYFEIVRGIQNWINSVENWKSNKIKLKL